MKVKNELQITGFYYLILIGLTVLGEAIDKTNMAGPGGGMIVLFLGVIGIIVLLIRNIIYFKKGRDHKLSLLIHALVLAIPIVIFIGMALFKN